MTLSALEKRPTGPVRGIVLALHGGGYRAGYWDFQASSLLDIAAARGCLAVAIDRPGYGAARAFPMPLAQQASVVLQLAADLRAREGGAPLLLAGHSMGGILALIAGADPRATAILAAIDACGVPLRYQPAMQEALLGWRLPPGESHFPPLDAEHGRETFFAADGSFDPAALDHAAAISAPVPGAEMPDAANAPQVLPALMRKITVPVRLTFAGKERSSIADATIAAAARADLSTSARADVRFEPGTGHNISLHHAASAFHHGIVDWLFANTMDQA